MFKKVGKKIVAVALPLAGAVGSAQAALPAAATTAFSDLTADAGSLVSLVWPVAAIASGGLALIVLFKKGIFKGV